MSDESLLDCLSVPDPCQETTVPWQGSPVDCLTPEQADAYREYHVEVSYITDEGKLHLPVSDGSSVVIPTHAPIQRKVITWWAERIDVPPVVPGPNLFDPNSELLRSDGPFMSVRPSDDDQRIIYRLSGCYTYAQLQPVRSNFPGANSPVLGHYGNDIRLPASVFDDQLAATNGNPGDL